ncbi:MAG: patatin-like phospholipase family protein [Bacteroidota bacterium]
MLKTFLATLFVTLFAVSSTYAQKVGLVLSGGGADGLSHVGVLKCLEENKIPIDYITGTSMGALIGAFYASGYSPEEIEKLISSEKFKRIAQGDIEKKYLYYFKRRDADANWISFKFSTDTLLQASLPTNFVSPIPIDFALLEFFANQSAAAQYKFDSLLIPYRCVASDVTNKKLKVFKEGDLGQAVRASMSYPFYLKPININGNLYFDGGLYNNFPIDVMETEFKPDVIIGSNVSELISSPDEDDIISQVKSMVTNRSKNTSTNPNTVIIEPKVESISLFDFDASNKAVTAGYLAALEKINDIKKLVTRTEDIYLLNCKRHAFQTKKNAVIFDKIEITGLKKSQAKYVENLLLPKQKKLVTLEELKPKYFRLVADDKIKQIYPLSKHDSITGFYKLNLKIKKEKDVFAYFGGNFASRPINTGYIGVQYNYLGRIAVSTMANAYFGRFYSSYQVKTRADLPLHIPFYIEASVTRNSWDYFKSSTAFFEDTKPSFLVQAEFYGDANVGLPLGNKAKFVTGASYVNSNNRYYQSTNFSSADTSDRNVFIASTPYAFVEFNTLDKKQYATKGSYLLIKARYISGFETNTPGSTAQTNSLFSSEHKWLQLKISHENYYKQKGKLKLGYLIESVISNQPFFANYTATMLSAPAFLPIPESRTLFLPNFRTHNYAAFGIKNIYTIFKNLDARIEGYIFQPYREILSFEQDNSSIYDFALNKRYFIASGALVYNSPVGPISLSANYYDKTEKPFSLLFSFGYIIFNKKALD